MHSPRSSSTSFGSIHSSSHFPSPNLSYFSGIRPQDRPPSQKRDKISSPIFRSLFLDSVARPSRSNLRHSYHILAIKAIFIEIR